MESKKNTKANVGRNSSLYFAIGLAAMLFLTNFAINYKTYDKSDIDIGQLNLDELDDEEIPITMDERKIAFDNMMDNQHEYRQELSEAFEFCSKCRYGRQTICKLFGDAYNTGGDCLWEK